MLSKLINFSKFCILSQIHRFFHPSSLFFFHSFYVLFHFSIYAYVFGFQQLNNIWWNKSRNIPFEFGNKKSILNNCFAYSNTLSLSLFPFSRPYWVRQAFPSRFSAVAVFFQNVFTYLFIHLVLFGQSKRQRLKKCLFRLGILLRLHTVFSIKRNASNKNVQCTEMQD